MDICVGLDLVVIVAQELEGHGDRRLGHTGGIGHRLKLCQHGGSGPGQQRLVLGGHGAPDGGHIGLDLLGVGVGHVLGGRQRHDLFIQLGGVVAALQLQTGCHQRLILGHGSGVDGDDCLTAGVVQRLILLDEVFQLGQVAHSQRVSRRHGVHRVDEQLIRHTEDDLGPHGGVTLLLARVGHLLIEREVRTAGGIVLLLKLRHIRSADAVSIGLGDQVVVLVCGQGVAVPHVAAVHNVAQADDDILGERALLLAVYTGIEQAVIPVHTLLDGLQGLDAVIDKLLVRVSARSGDGRQHTAHRVGVRTVADALALVPKALELTLLDLLVVQRVHIADHVLRFGARQRRDGPRPDIQPLIVRIQRKALLHRHFAADGVAHGLGRELIPRSAGERTAALPCPEGRNVVEMLYIFSVIVVREIVGVAAQHDDLQNAGGPVGGICHLVPRRVHDILAVEVVIGDALRAGGGLRPENVPVAVKILGTFQRFLILPEHLLGQCFRFGGDRGIGDRSVLRIAGNEVVALHRQVVRGGDGQPIEVDFGINRDSLHTCKRLTVVDGGCRPCGKRNIQISVCRQMVIVVQIVGIGILVKFNVQLCAACDRDLRRCHAGGIDDLDGIVFRCLSIRRRHRDGEGLVRLAVQRFHIQKCAVRHTLAHHKTVHAGEGGRRAGDLRLYRHQDRVGKFVEASALSLVGIERLRDRKLIAAVHLPQRACRYIGVGRPKSYRLCLLQRGIRRVILGYTCRGFPLIIDQIYNARRSELRGTDTVSVRVSHIVDQIVRLKAGIDLHHVPAGLQGKGRADALRRVCLAVEAAAHRLAVHHDPAHLGFLPVGHKSGL